LADENSLKIAVSKFETLSAAQKAFLECIAAKIKEILFVRHSYSYRLVCAPINNKGMLF
jgi:hypothetical protein